MSQNGRVVVTSRGVSPVAVAAAAGAAISIAGVAHGQFSYVAPTTGNWNVATAWAGGVAPPNNVTTTTLSFDTGLAYNTPVPTINASNTTSATATNNIGSPFDFSSLSFRTGYSAGFTVIGTSGFSFRPAAAGGTISQNGQGNVTFSSTGAAIDLSNGGLTVNGSGVGNLTFSSVISGANGITISGSPSVQNVRVVNLNGANTFAGGITLRDNASVAFSVAGGTGTGPLTVHSTGGTLVGSTTLSSLSTSSIALNGTLRFIGTSGLTLTSATALSGSGNLEVRNSSASSLIIQSNSSGWTGALTVGRSDLGNISAVSGSVTLSGLNGTISGASAYNISNGGSLVLTSNTASTNNSNRISDTAPVNLRGGNLSLTGQFAGGSLTETAGNLTGAGHSVVTVAVGTTAGSTTLAMGTLNRTDNGTFLFRGTSLGTTGSVGFLTFSSSPTLIGGGGLAGSQNMSILPYATADGSASGLGSAFATYTVAGIRPLTTTEQATAFGASDLNVRLTAATANSATVTMNSLNLATLGGITGSGTLNITSGGLFNSANGNISNNINFGSAEGIYFSSGTTTLSGNLIGTGGFTRAGGSPTGSGTLTLSGNNAGLTGTLTLNNGMTQFGALSNLPGTGQIVFNSNLAGGTSGTGFIYSGSTPITLNRDIALNGGWTSMRNSAGAAGTTNMTLSGTISGSGGLYIDTVGDIALTGNNTYTGPTRVNNGNVRISSDANLGNGGMFDFGNGSSMGIILEGNWTTSRPINSSLTSGTLTFNTQSFNATLNGPLTNFASGGLGASSDSIRKTGSGTLNINAASTMGAYGMIINGGEVRLGNNGALNSTTYTVTAGTRLVLDNTTLPTGTGSGAQVTNRVNDSAIATLASGGTFRLIGNAAQQTGEFVGQISATGSGNNLYVDSSGGQLTVLHLGNLVSSGGSITVHAPNLGGTYSGSNSTGRIFLNQFNSVAVTNNQILANVLGEDTNNPGVFEQGVYSTLVGIRLLDPLVDYVNGAAIQNGAPTSLATTANFRVNPSITPLVGPAGQTPILGAANTVNALRLAPNGIADYNSAEPTYNAGNPGNNSTLTITSGSIVTEAGGSGASITQSNAGTGNLTVTAGASNMSITTNANLAFNAILGGSGGLTKTGNGTLTLQQTPTNTGAYNINGGTLALGTGVAPTMVGASSASTATLAIGANNIVVTGAAASNLLGTITGSGNIAYNPTSAATMTLGGNNTGLSGNFSSNNNGSFALTSATGFGSGAVTFGNTTTNNSLVTFNFGNNTTTTVANNFNLSSTAGINSGFANLSSSTNQTTILSGLITGGNAGANTILRVTSDAADTGAIVLANPNNSFTATVQIWEGILGITSDGVLGNVNNGISLGTTTSTTGGLRFDANNITLPATRALNFIDANVINTNGNDAAIAGVLSGTGAFNKTGGGTLTLSGASTNTGAWTVSAGTLLMNGSLAGATSPLTVTVNAGATLGGSGSIGLSATSLRNVTVNGNLSPGNSPGNLTIWGNLTLGSTAAYNAELEGTTLGTQYDSTSVNGTVTINAATVLNLTTQGLFIPTLTDTFFIVVNDGNDAVSGTFAGLPNNAAVTFGPGGTWSGNISYTGDFATGAITGGNDIVIYNVIPTPGTAGLMSIAGILAARRERRKA